MADDALTRKEAEMSRLTECLPCPFCGSADIRGHSSGSAVWAKCNGCGAQTDECEYGDEPPKRWNRRAPSLESVREEAKEADVGLFAAGRILGFAMGLEEAVKLCETQAPFLPSLAVALRTLKLQHAPARMAEGIETAWLLERSDLRPPHYWDGTHWNPDAFKAQRFNSEDAGHDFARSDDAPTGHLFGVVEHQFYAPAPASPAKEQPGEQNVTELVRLLKARADGDLQHPAELLCRNAAAFIEKLGQGWIPVAWIEHHKGGDNLVWDQPGKGLVKRAQIVLSAVPKSQLVQANRARGGTSRGTGKRRKKTGVRAIGGGRTIRPRP